MTITATQRAQRQVKIRPSSTNLFAKCVAAAHGENDQFVINWEGSAGVVGSALHRAAKALVLKEPIPHDEIRQKYGLSSAQQRDVRIMTACVRKYCLENLHAGGWSNTLIAEQPLDNTFETDKAIYDLGGTMDVGGFSADKTIWGTVDWKSTRLETTDYSPQQITYLWNSKEWIQKNLPPKKWPKYYQYHIVFVRDWTEEVSEAYTAEQLDAWVAGFLDRIESWDGREYHPGGHCIYCPRQADCPAVYAMVTAMSRALAHPEFTPTAEQASDAELVSFKIHASAVGNLIDGAMGLLKSIVVGRGGQVASPDGCLVTTYRPHYTIDPLIAWPLAQAVLTEQELADACKLSKGALLTGVSNHFPKGEKGKAKDAFWDSLCEAEAVVQSDSLILNLKKAKLVNETNFQE